MKKQLLTLCAILMIGTIVSAQEGSFNKGDNLINIGIGLGSPFFGSGYSASLPINPSVSFEHGVNDVISIGGQISYASAKYTYNGYGYYDESFSFKQSATYVGFRGSYHFNEALSLADKWDLYGGASLGYVIVSASDVNGYDYASASAFGYGLYGGGKYFFSKRTGIYAELGYQSLSFLNVGLSLKF